MNCIKNIREARNLTQLDLSEKVSLSVVTISRYENGLREPRASDIKKLCEVLGCSESELLNGPEDLDNVFARARKCAEETLIAQGKINSVSV